MRIRQGLFFYKMKKIMQLIILLSIFAGILLQNELGAEEHRLRIISLAPSTTEILFALDLADEIVGVTTFCNYPPAALNKEKVGTFSQPDIEKIVFLKPDIIFATGLEQAPIVDKLRKLGMKIIVSDPSAMKELFGSIEQIGNLTHRNKEATLLINSMKARIKKVQAKVKKIPSNKRLKIFVEIWHDPLMTAGKGSFVDELVGLAGGINIAHDTPRPYSYFSAEELIARDPDCIIFGYMVKNITSEVKNRLGWSKIKAAESNRLYNDIDSDLFLRPGPRLVEGLEEIHKRLYVK